MTMNPHDFELTLESKLFDAADVRVQHVRAREQMSRLYEVSLKILCPAEHPLDLDEVAGSEATAVITPAGGRARRFHGVVTRVREATSLESTWLVYEIEIAPRLWRGTMVETLDVHLDLSVPEILEKKLGLIDLGAGTDFEMQLGGTYPKREFVVQFRETDFAFVSRLCEHLGIFYFFDQADHGDVLILGDDASAYRAIDGEDSSVRWSPRGDELRVYELAVSRGLVSSVFVCRDYDEQKPALELQSPPVSLEEGYAGGVIEYGGDFHTVAEASQLARVRADERLATRDLFEGKSCDLRFSAGHVFALEDHPRHSRRLLLVEVVHEAHQPVAGYGEDSAKAYDNRFVAIPAERTWRPQRRTPVPRVHGLLPGIVETGQGDVETYAKLDDQGRYTVKLLFDTAAPGERRASCAIRMLQPSAGPGYGMHFPLKPGVEVLIGFVDGNPDRPVIVGAAPNPLTPTPVTAATGTKSRIQTRSGILIEFEDRNRRA
jgi:type VI secretion system secreted protein VgrG